jgi:hypothetical protein
MRDRLQSVATQIVCGGGLARRRGTRIIVPVGTGYFSLPVCQRHDSLDVDFLLRDTDKTNLIKCATFLSVVLTLRVRRATHPFLVTQVIL